MLQRANQITNKENPDKGDEPLVSVIALCYNHAAYLDQCLDSIKNQSYSNMELIIVDDCSTDGSQDRIQKWVDMNQIACRLIANEVNGGICKSLNRALICARGKYISGIATDDVLLPGKIQQQVAIFETLPEKYGVIYTDALVIDENGKVSSKSFNELHRNMRPMPSGNIYPILLEGNFIPGMTALIRKQCYQRVGLYDESLVYEDWDMWLRIARHYHFYFSPIVSAKYRIVSTSMIRTMTDAFQESNIRICLKHLQDDRNREHRMKPILVIGSEFLWKRSYPGHQRFLLAKLRQEFKLSHLAQFAMAVLHLPHAYYDRMKCAYRNKVKPIIQKVFEN